MLQQHHRLVVQRHVQDDDSSHRMVPALPSPEDAHLHSLRVRLSDRRAVWLTYACSMARLQRRTAARTATAPPIGNQDSCVCVRVRVSVRVRVRVRARSSCATQVRRQHVRPIWRHSRRRTRPCAGANRHAYVAVLGWCLDDLLGCGLVVACVATGCCYDLVCLVALPYNISFILH